MSPVTPIIGMDETLIWGALALFKTTINSGEKWTPQCEEAYNKALSALERMIRQIKAAHNLGGVQWIDDPRMSSPPRQRGPLPDGTLVVSIIGGPIMIVEDTRDDDFVTARWLDDGDRMQRDTFNKDTLLVVRRPHET